MKIISWFIEAMLENGESIQLADIPDDVASVVDEWMSELEANQMEYEMECEGCKKEVIITGAYLGLIEDAWCECCGWEGENLDS